MKKICLSNEKWINTWAKNIQFDQKDIERTNIFIHNKRFLACFYQSLHNNAFDIGKDLIIRLKSVVMENFYLDQWPVYIFTFKALLASLTFVRNQEDDIA